MSVKEVDLKEVIGKHCFFCAGPITDVGAIVWRGVHSEPPLIGAPMSIMLHPACCLRLVLRLASDMRTYEKLSGTTASLVKTPGKKDKG